MTEMDYKILVHFVRYAEHIEYFTKYHFKGKLEVFRNRPRTPGVTMPKAICLLFTYKLSACAEHISEELKSLHPEVPWEKSQTFARPSSPGRKASLIRWRHGRF